MKLAILKPIMWNDKGYMRPAGCPSTSGYSKDNGFGHEEWNGNSLWNWNGYRIFHTETQPKLDVAATNGDLGMVMIAAHEAKAYAMGVATNVYTNTRAEMNAIAQALNIAKEADYLWSLPAVKKAFKDARADFDKHWHKQYQWIRWKCPQDNYYWFPKPLLLDPARISGKTRLAMHHSKYTLTTPEVILDIVNTHLPKTSAAILDWLSFGDFLQPKKVASISQTSGTKNRINIQKRRNAPTDRRFQYWVEGNREVEPLHYRLQTLFVEHLTAKGIPFHDNDNYIDVHYTVNNKTIFCEIKPTDNLEPRYAIRAAVGQLLEYRFNHNPKAELEIVLGKKPANNEIAFVKSLGFRLCYFDLKHNTFIYV